MSTDELGNLYYLRHFSQDRALWTPHPSRARQFPTQKDADAAMAIVQQIKGRHALESTDLALCEAYPFFHPLAPNPEP